MEQKSKLSFLLLAASIGAMAYLDSPYSFINKDFLQIKDSASPVQAMANPKNSTLPKLEQVLIKRDRRNGYIFETYQEFEVTSDEQGKIINRKATSHYEYLKYKDYSQEVTPQTAP